MTSHQQQVSPTGRGFPNPRHVTSIRRGQEVMGLNALSATCWWRAIGSSSFSWVPGPSVSAGLGESREDLWWDCLESLDKPMENCMLLQGTIVEYFFGFDLKTPSLHPRAGWRLRVRAWKKKSQDVDVQFGHPVAIDQLRNDKWCRHWIEQWPKRKPIDELIEPTPRMREIHVDPWAA